MALILNLIDIVASVVFAHLVLQHTNNDFLNFRNDAPRPSTTFWDRKFVIYFASCFGTNFIFDIFKFIAFKIDAKFFYIFDGGNTIVLIILNLAAIVIMIVTSIIVVNKLCNKTLRELDDARAFRRFTIDR